MKFYIVDVFAEQAYEGNQLAVCIPDGAISQERMQQIAQEINFSETSFILSGKQENGGYDVRIFAPDEELPFAGHPTLGTAYVIQRFIENKESSEIKLNLEVGQIPVKLNGEEGWMQQNEPVFSSVTDGETIADVLQITAEEIEETLPIQVVSTGLPSLIVPVKTLEAVKQCTLNFPQYNRLLEKIGRVNLLIFTKETVHSVNDLHVRVFMFPHGHEDPATGSANGNLAGYLVEHHALGGSRISYSVEQGYAINRKSLLKAAAEKHHSGYSIQIGGKVFAVAEGKWL